MVHQSQVGLTRVATAHSLKDSCAARLCRHVQNLADVVVCLHDLHTEAMHSKDKALTERVQQSQQAGGMSRQGMHTLSTSSEKSFGWGDVNRMRISGQATAHSWSSSAKERAPFRRFSGLYTELNPCKSRCISLA